MNSESNQPLYKHGEDSPGHDSSLQRAPSAQSHSRFNHMSYAPSNMMPFPSSPESHHFHDPNLPSMKETLRPIQAWDDGVHESQSRRQISTGYENKEGPDGSSRKKPPIHRTYSQTCEPGRKWYMIYYDRQNKLVIIQSNYHYFITFRLLDAHGIRWQVCPWSRKCARFSSANQL